MNDKGTDRFEYYFAADGAQAGTGKGFATIEQYKQLLEQERTNKATVEREKDRAQKDYEQVYAEYTVLKTKYDCFVWKGAAPQWVCGSDHMTTSQHDNLVGGYEKKSQDIIVKRTILNDKKNQLDLINNKITSYLNSISYLEQQNASNAMSAASAAAASSSENAEKLMNQAEEAEKKRKAAEDALNKFKSDEEKAKREAEEKAELERQKQMADAESEAVKIKAKEEIVSETEKSLKKEDTKKYLIFGAAGIAVLAFIYFGFIKK